MKRTRKKTTKQETLQQPTVAITMTAEDKAAAEKVAALREAEAAQKARGLSKLPRALCWNKFDKLCNQAPPRSEEHTSELQSR